MSCADMIAARAQLAPPIEPASNAAALLAAPMTVLLDVTVNNEASHTIQPFVLTPPTHLVAQRQVLEAIGIAVEGDGAPTTLVELDQLAGVTYRLDLPAQAIAFHLPDSRRHRKIYDVHAGSAAPPAPAADWGAFLNYSVFAAEQSDPRDLFRFSGVNAAVDGHVFGPYGTLDQTAILGSTLGRDHSTLRLETGYTLQDQDRLLTGRVGDSITGGLNWTRPIRLGGLQLQRDLALQPGLVTQPLPSYTGSAAVPSTVDVFVGSAKLMSEKVDPGPYQLVNIPSLSNGVANVVVTDATGRQTQSSLQLYNTTSLLQPTLVDFSVEAGFARRNFGVLSNDYDLDPVLVATSRAGLTPVLTAEAHAEVGAGVINASAGAVTATPWGNLEGAMGVSSYRGEVGGLVYAAYEVESWGVLFRASGQARTDAFNDLAGATARWQDITPHAAPLTPYSELGAADLPGFTSYAPPRSLGQLSAYAPLPFWGGTANVSLIDLRDADTPREDLISASVNIPLPRRISLFGTLFTNLDGRGAGVLAGLSMPLGDDISVGASSGAFGSATTTVTAQRALGRGAGSFGWQVADLDAFGHADKLASAAYRTGFGTVGAGVTQQGGTFGGTASFDGSIAAVDGAVALGEHIDDSFAMVQAGIPGVAVLQDNRRIGTTDPFGHLVVPGLSTFQPNRIALDPLTLPIHAEAASTESVVVPAHWSGTLVDFRGEQDVRAGLIVLLDSAGHPLPPGAKGHLDGEDGSFIVGYGGQAYVRHLGAANAATVETATGECHAAFAFNAAAADATARTASCL